MNEEMDAPKSEWGPGPWQDEPDRVEWEYKGFPCLMVRNMGVTGVWCGYVAVPEGHPEFEKGGDDLDVHGGITYSNHCSGDICHVPKPGEPDNVWWLGFDCSHFADFMPRMDALLKKIRASGGLGYGKYRDLPYVKSEVERLADQLAAL